MSRLNNRPASLATVLTLISALLVLVPRPANAAPPEVTNLELAQATSYAVPFTDGFVFLVDEAAQGVDLNGDSDMTDDKVWHVYRPSTGVVNLGLATSNSPISTEYEDGFGLWGDEILQNEDLNGDGDKLDTAVWHTYSFTDGLINLGLATVAPTAFWPVENGFAFWVSEAAQATGIGLDLNSDGIVNDDQYVWHVYDPEDGISNIGLAASPTILHPDYRIGAGILIHGSEFAEDQILNGDGDKLDAFVWHLWENGTLTNLELAGSGPYGRAIDGGLAFNVSESHQNVDFNGDADKTDQGWHVYNRSTGDIYSLGIAATSVSTWDAGGGFGFSVSETAEGLSGSLNSDADDTDEMVFHAYSIANGLTNLGIASDNLKVVPITGGFAIQVSEVSQDAILNSDGDKIDTRVWHVFRDGIGVTNLGLAADASIGVAYEDGFAFTVDEVAQDMFLNSDGDKLDTRVIHIWDPVINTIGLNLGVATAGAKLIVNGPVLGFTVYEGFQGNTILNLDGDSSDSVWFAYVIGSGLDNLGAADGFPTAAGPAGNGFAFTVSEAGQGNTILNGDGDATDTTVWHHYDPDNLVTNLGLASERISGNMLDASFSTGFGFTVNETLQNANLNGDADSTDLAVWHVIESPPPSVIRYSGANRYATAAAISQAEFPDPIQVDKVFVAVGTNFPDALAGAAVAGKQGAPLLLVQTNGIPAETVAELTRLNPSDIVILGGTAVVSAGVETQLSGYGTTTRLAGNNRYTTAVEISKYGFPSDGSADEVVVATGLNFADALAGGPAAVAHNGPVLLTDPNSLPAAVAAEITRLAPTRIVVVGGTAAVSNAVEAELSALATTVRISGSNRYNTAVAISVDAFGSAARTYVATGLNFPDALAGAVVAGYRGVPVLLVPGSSIPTSVTDEVTRLGVSQIVILGGTGVVTTGVENAFATLLGL